MRFKWLILLLLLPSAAQSGFDESLWEPFEGRTVVDIEITGNNITKIHVVTREIHTQTGEPLSLEVIDQDVNRLENLGIFASVDVLLLDCPGGVCVEFRLREMPSIIPYVAFRYNEENGWSVGPAACSVNLLGKDIYVTGRVLFGGTTTFDVQLTWPWIAGNHVSFDVNAAHLIRDNVILEFEEESDEITPWLGRYIGTRGRAKVLPFGWFRMRSDQPGITLSGNDVDNLYRVGLGVGFDSRNSWRNPTRGWWNEIEVVRTFGDGDFWTTVFDFRRFQPTWSRQSVVFGALTSLQSGTVGVDVPRYLQYFMGGANSIRGYEFDVLGKELYGKNQFIFTLEYQFLLLGIRAIPVWRWAFAAGLEVALFSDTGTAWSSDTDLKWDRVKTGVGAGLRVLIPGVDVARFDIAVGEDGKVHFHFGVWSKLVAQRPRVR